MQVEADRHHHLLPTAKGADLTLPIVQELAQKYQRSASQVVLNWLVSKGIVAIPRSARVEHIEDNFRTLDWELAPEDVEHLDRVNTNNRGTRPAIAEFDSP